MRLFFVRNSNFLTVALFALLSLPLGARADYQTTVLGQGPVGYWRLNETTPPPIGPILATNAGSVGAPGNGVYLAGYRGLTPGAIASEPASPYVGFKGTDGNRVRVPFQTQWNPSGPMTIEFWAKPAQTNELACPAASVEFIEPALLSDTPPRQRNGWLCYQGDSTLTNGSGWNFREYNSTALTNLTSASVDMSLDTNQWYYVVGVYDGTNISTYVNGVLRASTNFAGVPRPNTNSLIPLTFGARADGASGYFSYSGSIDEAALYNVALSPSRILAHYQTGTNTAPQTSYSQMVLADAPIGYWRFNEPPDPTAANLGTLGSTATGTYIYNAAPGAAGPRPPPYPGFEATNHSVSFDGVGAGYVSVPALNLNTNAVTITAWINANGSQIPGTGIIFNRSGTTTAGLTIDIGGGLGLSYNWDDDPSTYNWASGVSLALSDWTYIALIVQPTQAALYAAAANDATTWNSGTNFTTHVLQAFEGPTVFGADFAPGTNLLFAGNIDEVAIFNRALSEGEVYSAYGSAVGGVAPQIFSDVSPPANPPFLGETVSLSIDAGGTPSLGYQWRKDGTPIAGATGSTLAITNLQPGDAGTYDVVITNAFGTANSSPAVLTTQAPTAPLISQGPSGRTLYPGGLLDLRVSASGGQLQYQWQLAGTNLPGATTSAYVVDSVSAIDAGVYQVFVTNSLGSASAGPITINVIVPTANTYAATIVDDGPEAWWRLDELPGATIMVDAMGRHDGAYVGGVTMGAAGAISNGVPNTAVSFNGTDSYGDVPYSSGLNSAEFTIEVWTFLTDQTLQRGVISSYDTTAHKGIFFKANPDGTCESDVGNNDGYIWYYAPMGNITVGRWTHLASTFSNGDGQNNYVNGQLVSGPFDDFVRNSKFDFLIGAVGTNFQGIARWKGTLDEVAVYKKALTPQQIQNHYVQALYGSSTKPLFLTQPQPVTRAVGDPASFSATVEGSLPITFQWYKDGAAVTSATNSSLSLSNLVLSDTGSYQLVASNPAGSNASTAAFLTVLPTVTFANATNGLVLHLKFDGDYSDASGRGNSGTPIGAPKFIQGQIGQALRYNTTTNGNGSVTTANYVTLGTPDDLHFGSNTSFSVAFWVRLPESAHPGDLPFFASAINSANNQGFTFCPSYQLGGWQWSLQEIVGVVTNNVDVNGADDSINDGSWHHFAATFDRTTATALTYLDGEQVNSTPIASLGTFDNLNPISIGQDPTGRYPEAGSADLDDFGVWRRVLSPIEIYELNYSGAHFGAALDAYGPVSLAVVMSGAGPVVIWQAGTLLQAATPSGPWLPVQGATAPYYNVTPGATGSKYFRVHL